MQTCASAKYGKGGITAISTEGARLAAQSDASKARVCAAEAFIFQLPATNLRRIRRYSVEKVRSILTDFRLSKRVHPMTSTGYQGKWALVTGASSGIGQAYARSLAQRGCNLALTARRLDRLNALARSLMDEHAIETLCIQADLADEGALDQIEHQLKAPGIDIDILINNAGYGVPGHFHKSHWPEHEQFLRVLLIAPTELAHRLLPGMQARGWGRIVNVASLAGIIPGSAGNTLYGASKAYFIKFSQSLALENRSRNVLVQALCPGFTQSEFHDISGARHLMDKLPRFMFQTSEAVAEESLRALERGRIVHVSGVVNRLIAFVFKLLPDRLALWLIVKRSKDFRVQD